MVEVKETEKELQDPMSETVQSKAAKELLLRQRQTKTIRTILVREYPDFVKYVKRNPAMSKRTVAIFSRDFPIGEKVMRLLIHLGIASFCSRPQNGGEYAATFKAPESCPPYMLFRQKVSFFMEQRPPGYGPPGKQVVMIVEDTDAEEGGRLIAIIPEKDDADELARIFEWKVTDDR